MANILEFVRGVLTDGEAQGAFRADPPGYLERAGFADLTGEDVVEAVSVLRRSLPADTASALARFDDADELPGVRPSHDERELDAAARVLEFAVAQVPAAPTDDATSEQDFVPEPAATTEAQAVHHDHEPIAIESELDASAGPAPARAIHGGATPDVASVAAFAAALDAVARDARARHDEVLQLLVSEHETAARRAAEQLQAVLDQAAADADAIRAAAEASIAQERDAAAADRAAAASELERTRAEADHLLERAREQAEEVRRQSEQLLATAHAQAEAARQEIEARKVELREAERQLKERLTGIDSLFRTVLRDDEAGSAGPA